MISVAVIMSTYNGEKYLDEQIDSILNQTDLEVTLFVRDDGSSDGTKNILEKYARDNGNIHINFGENAGVGNSFMHALYSVPDTFDYYAFADQDDIWLENKLFQAVKALQESGKMLYASNQENTDKDGNSLGLRYKEDALINQTPLSILSVNMIAGCTMVFTNGFYKILCNADNRPSSVLLRNRIHDVWVAMVASLFDGIVYDKNSYILYRQHENNVVGAKSSLGKRLKNKFKKIKCKEYRNGRSMLAKEICEKFPDASERFPMISVCADSQTCKGRKNILKHRKELVSYTKESCLGFKFKVLFGLF